eukprot:TRINITY_DN572_c0_g8_i1.p1 TRINITY_DN572_c0_g8~~TRINITY_DN572_c0_g8_i1.p1  ORF type:complete len:2842 (+),score=386.31 TRINITY_DN572_c0_g8_i1:11260-19785(+)
MKNVLRYVCLWCLMSLSIGAWSQQGAKVVTTSMVDHEKYYLQVGLPYLGQIQSTTDGLQRKINPVDIRFPWGVLYLYETFSEESFSVSKGYFGDKVLISWLVRNNANNITSFKVYRRRKTVVAEPFVEIASLPSTATQYEDRYVDGGVLYEYKVKALGVFDTEIKYKNYITGIGYRNPTAVVGGSVSYKGGNPVKDVVVRAVPQGRDGISFGSAISISSQGYLSVFDLHKPITEVTTLQAWLKPQNGFTAQDNAVRLFRLSSSKGDNIDISFKLNTGATQYIEANVGGSIFQIHNYYPSGTLNAKGEDILLPVSDFNDKFVHVSVILKDDEIPSLYINGREMNQEFVQSAHLKALERNLDYRFPYFDLLETPQAINLTGALNDGSTYWKDVFIGGEKDILVDEIRIWNSELSSETIWNDFRRYIIGSENDLIVYLRLNEGVGDYAYDLSRKSFSYNKNHAQLFSDNFEKENNPAWISGEGNIPTTEQLDVIGVTDENGNYIIASLPYTGTGESYNITPMYGVHQFEPSQQLIFVGEGATVVNNVDFIDKSSFVFKGKVLYDTRGIFNSFVEVNTGDASSVNFSGLTDGDEYVSGPGILDDGYNYYEKSGEKYFKGSYWLNTAGTADDDSDDYLERYANIASEGVQIYIDGQIVLDENNNPVVSDSEGDFEINVPIGEHYISLKKDGHVFGYNGRFPAKKGTYKDFFEDADEQVCFIDSTRFSLVGKVVGGAVESEKEIGFGHNGLYRKEITNKDGQKENITISAVNNIGVAQLTLDYTPPAGNVTNYTKQKFLTNAETGEYRIDVLPLKYGIDQTTGIVIPSNPSLNLLSASEILDCSKPVSEKTPVYELPDGVELKGEPYRFEKSFTFRSVPVVRVIKQEYDKEIEIGDHSYSTEGFQYPVYSQFKPYALEMKRFERYVNFDESDEGIESLVPVTDGELRITNNLALPDSESMKVDSEDASLITYLFKAGLPSVSSPFTKTIDVKYRINGVDYEAENYLREGIILGGKSDGSQTFITAAPDFPDIILRDPPGSESFASIEKGESISITSESDFAKGGGVSTNLKVLIGVEFEAGGGLAGPVIKTEPVNNVETGITVASTTTDGQSLTKTYTFTQGISTSDDPETAGASSDLYIGQSKNYFYGSFNNVQVSGQIIGSSESLDLTNKDGETIYVSTQKAMYFNEEPSTTFFVFSQKHILETLIPELELVISNLDNGIISENDQGVQDRDYYVQQINLWRSVIRENEKTKYLAKNQREKYKAKMLDEVNRFQQAIETAIDEGDDPASEARLKSKLEESKEIETLLSTKFENNLSLDAGVGEITRSIETVNLSSSSVSYNVNIEETVANELGFKLNKAGLVNNNLVFSNQDLNSTLSEETEKSIAISYTLKDNDKMNLLNVDIVNAFDGNGPVFITKGGRTSCPYEGAQMSVFYNHASYVADDKDIQELDEDEQEELSAATQQIEQPQLSVEVADISNISEDKNAEFKLILENTGIAGTDDYFKLFVDNTTNPHNAKFNLGPNGTIVNVPVGERTEYSLTLGKSISDVYDYDDIRVVLQSECDDGVESDVIISAHFVPACTQVEIGKPLENWVYNIDGSSNTLPIELNGFNRLFNNFKKIDLEYRLNTSPTWVRLQTYYNNQEFYDEGLANNETDITLISSANVSYNWDITGMKLQDGEYELRARSSCTNGTEYISETVKGRIDLNSPLRFGTPTPGDGILASGDDLRVSFSEDIFYNQAVSRIEIKGETNQLPVNHKVSLRFEGEKNSLLIQNPLIPQGDLTIEFWLKNATTSASAVIVNQEEGVKIGLENGEIYFSLGGVTCQGNFNNDNAFHHYTFTYHQETGDFNIYEDDKVIGSKNSNSTILFQGSNSILVGGNTFIGNIHDLRLWSKSINLANAYANIYTKLIGNEKSLIGYWPLNEGHGDIAKDLARFKHGSVNTSWDIKPKGNAYEFTGSNYLTLDNVGHVLLTDEMDATFSFWMKTDVTQDATLFSNGHGDDTDPKQSSGKANKWAVNLHMDGNLYFANENRSYQLTSVALSDGQWHHVSLLLDRSGMLKTNIDAQYVSSHPVTNISGFSGNLIWLGARGQMDLASQVTVDKNYTGKLDEIRLWNTLRSKDQEARDRFNEVDFESVGLLLYAKMNRPEVPTSEGPLYYHAYTNRTIIPSKATVEGALNYTEDVPAIKPARELVKFQTTHVINGSEMVLEPVVTNWASLEGQTLDITVHRMFDEVNNMQQSPITWSVFVNRNDVSWSANGYEEVLALTNNAGENKTFEITLVNRGGKQQSYVISNVPYWLTLSSVSGVLSADSREVITATIDKDLAPDHYIEDLSLETDYGFDQKLQLDLTVLKSSPDWSVDPGDFRYSMNVIGKVKIDGVFSQTPYDKVVAMHNGQVRGLANMQHDKDYDDYFVYMVVYSNDASGEDMTFSIWDSSQGRVLEAAIDNMTSIGFVENKITGTKANPAIISNTQNVNEKISLNAGWTWISFNVEDSKFSDLNVLTRGMNLETSDKILSHSPSLLETYYKNGDQSGWSGTISSNGGVSTSKMYKVNLVHQQELNISGVAVDVKNWSFPVKENWNWIPYPLGRSIAVKDALAFYDAREGDVFKSQDAFVIYDPLSGWSGTLKYLEPGKGYMLKASVEQEFKYPEIFAKNGMVNSVENLENIQLHKYGSNLSAVVQLPEGYTELYVYDSNNELRGKAHLDDEVNRQLSFISVFGSGGEELTFHIGNGSEVKETGKTFSFSGNAVMGTIADPILLDGEILPKEKIFPNPFRTELNIQLYANDAEDVTIRLYNAMGQVAYTTEYVLLEGANLIKISPPIASGVYLLKVYCNDRIITRKVVKR